jgi:hypothetical protein
VGSNPIHKIAKTSGLTILKKKMEREIESYFHHKNRNRELFPSEKFRHYLPVINSKLRKT